VDKQERQKIILKIIKSQRMTSQTDLVEALENKGISCTQASVSRDLAELHVLKVEGAYKVNEFRAKSLSPLVGSLSVDRAGDHLVVIRTGPGSAQAAALIIDRAKLSGIVGTVAGDDTIFIAVKNREDQTVVMKNLHSIFGEMD
jgi:transcriptional regulator of arginine metabolism